MLTQRVPHFVLRILALASATLAIPAFVFSCIAFARGGSHYLTGTIAAGLIGFLLLAAAFFAFKQGGRKFDGQHPVASHRLLCAAAFLIALPALLGGSQCLWMSAILLNQDYLQWFPTTSWHSFGDRSNLSVLVEYYLVGSIFTHVGLFLLSFALFGGWLDRLARQSRDR